MTAGRPISPKQQKQKKCATFTLCQNSRVLQTYSTVHLNKHFKEKLAIRVSAQLRQITPRETKSLPFHNLSKNHSVSSQGASYKQKADCSQLKFCQKNTASSQQFWCHSQLDQIQWNHLWCEHNRPRTPSSPKTFYTTRNKEFVGGTCNPLPQ